MSFHKFALGTVQFGIPYGISNTSGQVESTEMFRILDILSEKGIKVLDTAKAYGTSEENIGKYIQNHLDSKFSIVTKVSEVSDINSAINDSLVKLNVDKLYAVMYHSFDLYKNNLDSFNQLLNAKQSGIIEKVGFSLYQPADVDFLLDAGCEFDIIQVPYNIFDRKFEHLFPILNSKHIEIHCRSIYLQGLFFLDPERLPTKLLPFKKSLQLLHHLCKKNDVTVSELCVGFVNQNKYVDKLVMGVTNSCELMENLSYFEKNSYIHSLGDEILDQIKEVEPSLLNPSNWS